MLLMISTLKKTDVNKINYYLYIGDQKHAHQDQKYFIQLQKELALKR